MDQMLLPVITAVYTVADNKKFLFRFRTTAVLRLVFTPYRERTFSVFIPYRKTERNYDSRNVCTYFRNCNYDIALALPSLSIVPSWFSVCISGNE